MQAIELETDITPDGHIQLPGRLWSPCPLDLVVG